MSSDGTATSDKIAGNRLWLWLVVRLNRWLLTGLILFSIFLVLVGASTLGLTPLRVTAEEHSSVEYLFSAFLGAIITGTTIVVTINQLVLSQELGAVGDQRTRMQESTAFRQDLEEITGTDVAPPGPAAVFITLLSGIETRARRVETVAARSANQEVRDALTAYTDELITNTRRISTELEDAQFGSFDVIWAVLGFNYSWQIYRLRQFEETHAGELGAETEREIEELSTALRLFAPAREHFKTLYFQWKLIDLSRVLLYISIPSLVVMALFVLFVDQTTMPGETAGVDNLVWLTSAGFAVGVAPFVVFIVYVLRIVTVAKQTLAMGPMILQESKRK